MFARRLRATTLQSQITRTRGFATLEELEGRIRAVNQTKSMCAAMQSIAAAKLPGVEAGLMKYREFYRTMDALWRIREDEEQPEGDEVLDDENILCIMS